MATTTTKLGLIKPDLTDVVDVGNLNDNADDIDAAVGFTICTSATRPATPWAGQVIYETDTGLSLVWDGSAWQPAGGGGGGVTISSTAPVSPSAGDLWLDDTDGSMYVYYTDPGGGASSWIGAVSRSGGILQVVSTTKTDTFAVTSTTLTDVTGLTASITPRSTSSKILVIASLAVGSQAGTVSAFSALLRDSTQIFQGDAASNRRRVSINVAEQGDGWIQSNLTHLDSPSSTSTLTYKIQLCGNNTNAVYLNRGRTDSDSNLYGRGASSITLIEVAG